MSNRPSIEVVLPSRGLPYDGLIPHGVMNLHSMTTAEEKLFAGISKRADFETVIDNLIRNCSDIPKGLKPEDLYVGDRAFLMMNIRAASYGAMYGFNLTCDNCKARWDHEIDITKDLEVREAPEDHEDPFKVELPISGDTVTIRLFRGYDERLIIKYVDQQNRKVDIRKVGDPGYTYRMALHLLAVDSANDPNDTFDETTAKGQILGLAMKYIDSLAAGDSSAIRDELEARTPGIVLAVETSCPKCDHAVETGLPITAEFFRAKSAAGLRDRPRVVSRSPR